mmetsp:Transcript_13693/g.34972  ORF Transcript_13693/g.34972 Transcript_13693/m.34972 type:complete len:202 (+) Transcript_13693:541-1146(+)
MQASDQHFQHPASSRGLAWLAPCKMLHARRSEHAVATPRRMMIYVYRSRGRASPPDVPSRGRTTDARASRGLAFIPLSYQLRRRRDLALFSAHVTTEASSTFEHVTVYVHRALVFIRSTCIRIVIRLCGVPRCDSRSTCSGPQVPLFFSPRCRSARLEPSIRQAAACSLVTPDSDTQCAHPRCRATLWTLWNKKRALFSLS